jgi:inosine-uridine nucleoside N-ribohydrolase
MGGVLNLPGNKSPVAEANYHKYRISAHARARAAHDTLGWAELSGC